MPSIAAQFHIRDPNRFYNPGVISIAPNAEVTWINYDNVVHTVTSGNLVDLQVYLTMEILILEDSSA
jgi:plastocyanin